MPDREKIIKALECCTVGNACVSECPYFIDFSMTDGKCITQSQADALALLKEQDHLIESLEYNLEITESNLRHYINGND